MKYVQLLFLLVGWLAFAGERAAAQSLSAALRDEGIAPLASAARERGNAVNGALLFTQQNLGCAGCHAQTSGEPLAPDLAALGPDVSDEHLVESLLEPSKVVKKGFEAAVVTTTSGKVYTGRIVVDSPQTLVLRDASPRQQRITLRRDEIDEVVASGKSYMPDGLVDQLANRQQFLDLVKYLSQIKATRAGSASAVATRPSGGEAIGEALHGLVLLDRFRCFACHELDVATSMVPPQQAPNLAWGSGKIDPAYVERFVADPHHVKPGTTMPDLLASLPPDDRAAAARELTHYVASLGDRVFQRQAFDATATDPGRELFHSVGCVVCHPPRDEDGAERLDEDSVPLGQLAEKYNLDGLVAFLENPHAPRPSGRMPNLRLNHWEALDVARYLLTGATTPGESERPFVVDAALAERGRLRFRELGCVHCHATTERHERPSYPKLTADRGEQGCLSATAGAWPQFDLNAAQRDAIRAAIARGSKPLDDQQQILLTLATFRCTSCHQRGAVGGVSPDRDDFFQTADPNLGPQGRIPPPLTGVGAKLKPTWMRQVLVSGRSIRPYMMTRMPQYGAENVAHLVDLFQRVDQLSDVADPKFDDEKAMRKTGAELVGTGGLNCIVCHTYQLKKAANMPAVDLTEMAERLKKNWFYHYMRDPQRLSPNTIMPSFWPGGRAMRTDILDGQTDLQIESLWQYLLEGRQAPTPRGLIVEPLELLATDEAVMLRRSYPGIGKRGIGVGYPQQVNLAFDAEQMRLAMIWQGKFADPGGVWRSQGHGTVRPLGTDLIRFAPGPDLDHAATPWVVDEERPPQHRFQGYRLDEQMRPRFRYRFADIEVEDYSVDVVDSATGRPFLRRTVTFTTPSRHDGLAFRAGTGKTIASRGDGVFLIDDKLQIRIDERHGATIVDAGEYRQLNVPLTVLDGSTRLTLEYKW